MFLPYARGGVRGGKASHLFKPGEFEPICGAKGEWGAYAQRKPLHSECRRRAGAFLPLNPRMTDEEVRRDDAAEDL